MSFSQCLRQLGQPIAYYPQLSNILGGVTAAVLFGQLFYWQDKTDNPLGVYKTLDELMDETGLTERELRSAREKLRDLGVVIETNKRLEHRLYFKVDYNALDDLMAMASFREEAKRHSPDCQHITPPNDKTSFREEAKRHFVNTEITTKTTTEITTDPISTSGKDFPPAKTGKKFVYTDDDLRAANWIFGLIKNLSPNVKTPAFENWANEIRLMRERDGRTHKDICELFKWANQNEFWASNILSPAKLREKWDQLEIKRNASPNVKRKESFAEKNSSDWSSPEKMAGVF